MIGALSPQKSVVAAVVGPLVAPYSYDKQDLRQSNKPPSALHWLGTDRLGQDQFSRLLIGARGSLLVGFVGQVGIVVIGLPAAYTISRYKQRGLAFAILAARITPYITFLVPWFAAFRFLHMVDTYAALVSTRFGDSSRPTIPAANSGLGKSFGNP